MSGLETIMERLCTSLVEAGRLSPDDLAYARRIQQSEGGRLDEILVGVGLVSEEVILRGLAVLYGRSFLTIEAIPPHKDLSLPEGLQDLACRHQFVPLSFDETSGLLRILVSLPPVDIFLEQLLSLPGVSSVEFDFATHSLIASLLYQSSPTESAKKIRSEGEEKQRAEVPEEPDFCSYCGADRPSDALIVCQECGMPFDERLISVGLPEGTTVGQYLIKDTIGRGGMAEVYDATDIRSGQRVALKILQSHLSSNPSAIQRFQREARALRRLHHPGIVEIYEYGFQDGVGLYIVTELLEGREFLDLLQDKEPVSLSLLTPVVLQICEALEYAHNHGVIHRDLKPDNILLLEDVSSQEIRVKLLDFGVARVEDAGVITQVGLALGTPRYMSPEQVAGRDLDQRTDIYSLGVILFEALTGHLLFEGESSYQLMLRHTYSNPPLLREVCPHQGYSEELEQLLQQSLAKEPSQRPISMSRMKERFLFAVESSQCLPADAGRGGADLSGGEGSSLDREEELLSSLLDPSEELLVPESLSGQGDQAGGVLDPGGESPLPEVLALERRGEESPLDSGGESPLPESFSGGGGEPGEETQLDVGGNAVSSEAFKRAEAGSRRRMVETQAIPVFHPVEIDPLLLVPDAASEEEEWLLQGSVERGALPEPLPPGAGREQGSPPPSGGEPPFRPPSAEQPLLGAVGTEASLSDGGAPPAEWGEEGGPFGEDLEFVLPEEQPEPASVPNLELELFEEEEDELEIERTAFSDAPSFDLFASPHEAAPSPQGGAPEEETHDLVGLLELTEQFMDEMGEEAAEGKHPPRPEPAGKGAASCEGAVPARKGSSRPTPPTSSAPMSSPASARRHPASTSPHSAPVTPRPASAASVSPAASRPTPAGPGPLPARQQQSPFPSSEAVASTVPAKAPLPSASGRGGGYNMSHPGRDAAASSPGPGIQPMPAVQLGAPSGSQKRGALRGARSGKALFLSRLLRLAVLVALLGAVGWAVWTFVLDGRIYDRDAPPSFGDRDPFSPSVTPPAVHKRRRVKRRRVKRRRVKRRRRGSRRSKKRGRWVYQYRPVWKWNARKKKWKMVRQRTKVWVPFKGKSSKRKKRSN